MKQRKRTILLVPSVRQGNGAGHLKRCLETAEELSLVHGADAAVLVREEGPTLAAVDGILEAFRSVHIRRDDKLVKVDLAVLDQRETRKAFVDELKGFALVVGLDEGGPARGYCDYLIDTLSPARRGSRPNRTIQAARAPRGRRDKPARAHESILVTFGGEDPAGLTTLVCASLADGGVEPKRITVVRGPSAPVWDLPAGISVRENEWNLREILHGYDLVVTSFGLTAFEALSAGVAVLLVNPTPYHTRLSNEAGFPCAGTGQVDGAFLMEAIEKPREFAQKMDRLKVRLVQSGWDPDADGLALLSEVLTTLSIEGLACCPVCGDRVGSAVARSDARSYFRCSCTGLIYQRSFTPARKIYDEKYFFAEYQAQYGRTYLEDFQKIKALSHARLRVISRTQTAGAAVLDVGCAYGPFLDEATEMGFCCYGTDISADAVKYVSAQLKIPAAQADFADFDPDRTFGRSQFDVLTMWYVIEHFDDLDKILRKAACLVRTGGVFAFSTPSARGISGRRSMADFLLNSPADHLTVWSPRNARKVLRRYGFRVRTVRVTGHHPERFPGMRRMTAGFFFHLVSVFSKILGLGDTFEVYAVRYADDGS